LPSSPKPRKGGGREEIESGKIVPLTTQKAPTNREGSRGTAARRDGVAHPRKNLLLLPRKRSKKKKTKKSANRRSSRKEE